MPGAGAKPRSGSSALRRASIACPRAAGGSPSSRPPAATWICSLTRSRPVVASVTGCSTWRRVLTSRKASARSCGLVEELDGAGVAVPGRQHQVDRAERRSAASCSASSTGEADSSISFWLRRWTEQSRTPTAQAVPWSSAITCTSTWRAPGHEPLHQHARVAERPPGLVARPLEGRQQLGLGAHDPDPAPAAAGGRLDHQREADRGRVAERVRVGVHRAAAPLGDRDPDLLGEQLGGDLVAEPPHRVGRAGR